MSAVVALAEPSPRVRPAPTRRKLHLGHFAFARALVQGLDTRQNWNRYLRVEGEHTDIRTVRKTIQWLRDEFAAAAKRHDRHGVARLVRVDVSKIPDTAPAVPSLDDFIAERGLEDFPVAEQMEHYREAYGDGDQRASRRARLIAKQLDALRWLEGLVAEHPRAGDAVSAWLHPDLAQRIEAAGIATLQQLVERVNGVGLHWARSIPAIGAGKAERIVEWLRHHEETIGSRVGAHALLPRARLSAVALQGIVPRATAVVPIHKFVVPAELSGETGLYRAPQHLSLIHARNDYEAILVWVRSKHGLPAAQIREIKRKRGIDPDAPEGRLDWLEYLSNTQRAYLKEAERFLLWAIMQRQKPLSSMALDDCVAYRDFLADPQPAERWCAPRARERWSPLWRPFEGPLSPAAQRRAVTILKGLYRWLVDQCYLRGNPWGGVTTPKTATKSVNAGRSLTRGQWEFIESRLDALAPTSANLRLRVALRLAYATGLRLSELVAVRVSDLVWHSYPPDRSDDDPVEVWELSVIGKGTKARTVPVGPVVIDELCAYLASRGFPRDLAMVPGDIFLLGMATDVSERAPWSPAAAKPVDHAKGVGAATLADQFKVFFARCARVLAETDMAGAKRLAQASAHWLRHTHGSHAIAAGMDIKVVQQNLGHASLATTTIYTTSEERRRAQETAKLWGAGKRRDEA